MFHSIHGIFIHLSIAKITYLIKNEVSKSYEPMTKSTYFKNSTLNCYILGF